MRFVLVLLGLFFGTACGFNPAIDQPCAYDPCGATCRLRLGYCNQPLADGGRHACYQDFDWCKSDAGNDAGN